MNLTLNPPCMDLAPFPVEGFDYKYIPVGWADFPGSGLLTISFVYPTRGRTKAGPRETL